MKNYGPLIAIGRPGEWAPPLGAARLYLDETWQAEVLELMRTCRLIVVMLGGTPGLAWELRQLMRHKVLKKVVLVLPPVDAVELRRRWAMFVTIAQKESIKVPEGVSERAVLATFGNDNPCEIHQSPGARRHWLFNGGRAANYITPLKAILARGSFRGLGKTERPARKSAWVTAVAVVTLCLAALSLCCGALSYAMSGQDLHEARSSAQPDVLMILSVLSVLWGALAVPAGIGVLMRRQWGRMLCLINAALAVIFAITELALLQFVFIFSGFYTIYAIWVFIVLLLPSSRREFSRNFAGEKQR